MQQEWTRVGQVEMSMIRKQLQGAEELITSHFVSIVGQSSLQKRTKLSATSLIKPWEGRHKACLKEHRWSL
jgi:hypothetical protein